jgi:hypothetical protein
MVELPICLGVREGAHIVRRDARIAQHARRTRAVLIHGSPRSGVEKFPLPIRAIDKPFVEKITEAFLRLYTDKTFQHGVIANIANEHVRAFWRKEYPKYTYRYEAEAIAPIQNKVGAFLADRRLYQFFVAPKRPLRLRSLMDEGKILVVNLARGQIGADSAGLAGGLLVTAISLAAFSRDPSGKNSGDPSMSISTNSRPSRP